MPPKKSGPEQVADFFANIDHPLEPAMEKIREVILAADETITEQIKWKGPSFCYNSDDRVTFNVRNDALLLIFHRGAKIKDSTGSGRLIEDPTGLLQWITDDRATIKFTSEDEVDQKRSELTKVIQLWIAAAG
ncbi:MAG: DUF1801 domain-containing protein [Acidobacteria bacterium]|nr:DUF1801 domain-containing protein [Acidobacteriota bacterium]